MAKSSLDRKHAVRCEVSIPELTKAGTSVSFEIYAEGEKIGDIVLGRGSIEWRGGGRKNSKRISWSDFAKLMDRLYYRD
jgi:hypothetical protein